MDDYAFGSKRNKKKGKFREKKKHPYKSGGKFRSTPIDETDGKKRTKKKK